MIRHFGSMAILLALVLLIGGSAWAQSRPASSPAISADQRKPKLAVAVSAQDRTRGRILELLAK